MDGDGRSQPVTADQSDVRPTQGLPRDGKVGPKASATPQRGPPAPSTNRYPPLPSQKLPSGMVARSIAFDSAATVTMKGDAADVRDLRSTNGTYVNTERLIPHTFRILRLGDEITVGNGSLLRWVVEPAGSSSDEA